MDRLPEDVVRGVADFLYGDPHAPRLAHVCRTWRALLIDHHRVYRSAGASWETIQHAVAHAPHARHLCLVVTPTESIQDLALLVALGWVVDWRCAGAPHTLTVCSAARSPFGCVAMDRCYGDALRALLKAVAPHVREIHVEGSGIPLIDDVPLHPALFPSGLRCLRLRGGLRGDSEHLAPLLMLAFAQVSEDLELRIDPRFCGHPTATAVLSARVCVCAPLFRIGRFCCDPAMAPQCPRLRSLTLDLDGCTAPDFVLQQFWEGLLRLPHLERLALLLHRAPGAAGMLRQRGDASGGGLRHLHLGLDDTDLMNANFVGSVLPLMRRLPALRSLVVHAHHNPLTDAAMPAAHADPRWRIEHPDVLRHVVYHLGGTRLSVAGRQRAAALGAAGPIRILTDPIDPMVEATAESSNEGDLDGTAFWNH